VTHLDSWTFDRFLNKEVSHNVLPSIVVRRSPLSWFKISKKKMEMVWYKTHSL